MSSYRDPLAMALELLADRQKRVAELFASIRPAQRAVLGDEDRSRLESASSAIAAVPATQEELDRVNGQLDSIEQIVVGANAALSVDAAASVAPSTAPTNKIVALFLNHVVAPFGGAATQEGSRLIARAVALGVDVELEADIALSDRLAAQRGTFTLTSRAPRALAAIRVSPQGRALSFAKKLHLVSEREVGEAAFDDAYWVRGDEDAVRAVLTADVVRILTMISEHAPTLEIAEGTVRLTWDARSSETLDAAVYSRTEDHIERVVPRAAFALHVAIRRALVPVPQAAPPRAEPPAAVSRPEPPSPVVPSRLEELRELFREYGFAWGRYQQSAYGVPNDANDYEPQIQALGTLDLPVLDQLAASGDEQVAPWARGRANEIRGQVIRERVEKMGIGEASKLASEFLADGADPQLRDIVVLRVRDARDTEYVAELVTHMIAPDGGRRFARVMADEKLYNRVAIHRAVTALLRHGRGEVVSALLALPSPIGVDAALAVAWLAPTSPAADALERGMHTMSVERRREIASRFTGAHPPVDTAIFRRFFDDADAEVRRITIGALLHRGDEADFAAVVRALHGDADAGVRQWAARALEAVGNHASVREAALSELRRAYESDPTVRTEALGSIMTMRRATAPKTQDPRAEFERSFAAFVREHARWSTTLEDVVYFGHEMMSADAAVGRPILAAALDDPRAEELRQHLAFRL